ncbi:MAG: thiamine ABC transporter substrate binding subunit [Phyllobacteriaceae bacterium]|nr:thiamine ABC transporter substrate binding subunit [Phyllobacteriaceae bacterium]
MRSVLPIPFLAVVLAAPAGAAETLTIYTYDGFTAEWGPGPPIEKAFEAECGCDLVFSTAVDGVALLNRLKIEGERAKADIVLGLDTGLIADARETGLFTPHGVDDTMVKTPGGFADDMFIAFDYGHFAVVYDTQKLAAPPKSLKELVEGDPAEKIILEDPRTSTPGLGLVLWMKAVYGDKAGEAWARLKDRVLTVAPGWSEAYGLFTKGEAPMVLSYTTSPAYHVIAEKSERYKAAAFTEGHYLQVEVAGMTGKGAENPLARQFLTFMTGPGFQDVIPETNWMFPAGKTAKPLDPAFEALVKPEKTFLIAPEDVAANRKAWVDEWLAAMGR